MSATSVALRAGAILDIPSRTRSLLLVAGLAGVVVIVMGTLTSTRPGTVPLDKLLHFGGYTTLATLFTLALRPVLYVPALLGLGALGFALEILQRHTGRSFDPRDGFANLLGITIGGCAGLLIRLGYGYIRKELAVIEVRRRLVGFDAGAVILRQGEAVDQFYILKQGTVRLSRSADGREVDLGSAGPGDAVGLLAVVQGTAQYATVTAETPTVIYRMGMEQLFDAAGGQEQPVAVMLRSMAAKLRDAGDQLVAGGPGRLDRS